MRLCAEPAFGVSGAHRQVVAPSITPHRPGGRIKTNQRGCLKLARWVRAGELTVVTIPHARDEATSVFPAQAGIHFAFTGVFPHKQLDSGLRRNDGTKRPVSE